MTTRAWAVVVVAAAVVAAGPALAGPPQAIESRGSAGVLSGPEALRVDLVGDNDSLWYPIAPTGIPYDRWLTASERVGVRASASDDWVPSWAARAMVSASLAHEMYTPHTAEVASVAELDGDRPYSGRLFTTFGAELVVPRAPLALMSSSLAYTHLGVDVAAGVIGPWSLAGPIQYNAHWSYLRFEGKPLPPQLGWGRIETAPALTADGAAFVETSLLAAALDLPEPIYSWTRLLGGAPSLQWRVGADADGGTTRVSTAVGSAVAAGWMGDPRTGVDEDAWLPVAAYVFLRGEARAVAYNATIDAPIIDGAVVAHSAPFVGEVSAGAVLRVWKLEATYGSAYRSNEVATLQPRMRTGQIIQRFGVAFVF